jgi:hypothetical protein
MPSEMWEKAYEERFGEPPDALTKRVYKSVHDDLAEFYLVPREDVQEDKQ